MPLCRQTSQNAGWIPWSKVSPLNQGKLKRTWPCVAKSISVPVHLPSQITHRSFMHRGSGGREIRGHVMFESVLADVMQQLLQLRNLHHTHTAKRIQRIVGERTFSDISAHHSGGVVG